MKTRIADILFSIALVLFVFPLVVGYLLAAFIAGCFPNFIDEPKARSVLKARSAVQSGGSRNADGGRSCQS